MKYVLDNHNRPVVSANEVGLLLMYLHIVNTFSYECLDRYISFFNVSFFFLPDINDTWPWVLVHFPDVEGTEWPQLVSNCDDVLDVISDNKLLCDILSTVQGKTFTVRLHCTSMN